MSHYLTRPLLCTKLKDPQQLNFPLLLTPKFDGVRCVKINGLVLSRGFKLIPNEYVQELVSTLPDGCDGELVVPDGDFSDSQSGVMRRSGRPRFLYCVFDFAPHGTLHRPYRERVLSLPDAPFVHRVLPYCADDLDDFLAYEEAVLAKGYEGIIARSPDSEYLCGRQGAAFKWKHTEESEAKIVGFEEQNENTNEIVRNIWGRAKRPGGSDGKVPKGTLGSFKCVDIHSGVEFSCGTGKGLTKALRQLIWDNRPAYLHRCIRYMYQWCGTKDRPRFPSFACFLEGSDA